MLTDNALVGWETTGHNLSGAVSPLAAPWSHHWCKFAICLQNIVKYYVT